MIVLKVFIASHMHISDDPSFGPLLYNNGRLLGNISMTASSIFDSTSDSFAADVQWGSMWRSEVNEFQWLQVHNKLPLFMYLVS